MFDNFGFNLEIFNLVHPYTHIYLKHARHCLHTFTFFTLRNDFLFLKHEKRDAAQHISPAHLQTHKEEWLILKPKVSCFLAAGQIRNNKKRIYACT